MARRSPEDVSANPQQRIDTPRRNLNSIFNQLAPGTLGSTEPVIPTAYPAAPSDVSADQQRQRANLERDLTSTFNRLASETAANNSRNSEQPIPTGHPRPPLFFSDMLSTPNTHQAGNEDVEMADVQTPPSLLTQQ